MTRTAGSSRSTDSRQDDAGQVCSHTPCPSDYVAWHEWAEKMAETHYQVRCDTCGLWRVWVPKNRAWRPPDAPEASCLVCGYLRTLAIFKDGTDAGVCQECVTIIREARS